ncbi:MAG TPA: hypothetical protein PK698_07685 [Bacilli bacterium]|nr:hypothetical protein [Bacilli bacterium]HOH62324.1 hypothetical protein [Bacilli bacterium]
MKKIRYIVVISLIICLLFFINNYVRMKNNFNMILGLSDVIISLEKYYKNNKKYPEEIEFLFPKYLSKKPHLPLNYVYYYENSKDYTIYYEYERTILRENLFYVTYKASRKSWKIEELP